MWDESADKFTLGTTTATADSTGNISVTTGTLVANLEGTISANTVSSTQLVSATTLLILDSSGSTLKTIIGAGS
jgi:hypothetical protein